MHHKIKIHPRNENRVMDLTNCMVEIDGKLINHLQSVKFECSAKNLGVVTLVLLGAVEIEGEVDVAEAPVKNE